MGITSIFEKIRTRKQKNTQDSGQTDGAEKATTESSNALIILGVKFNASSNTVMQQVTFHKKIDSYSG